MLLNDHMKVVRLQTHSRVTEQPKICKFCLLESLGVVKIQSVLVIRQLETKASGSFITMAFQLPDSYAARVQLSTSFACRSEGTSKDPISLHVPGGGKGRKKKILKCAPAERTRLPDWCLTFLLESPDSLQIFIRAGANKVSRLSRKSGL